MALIKELKPVCVAGFVKGGASNKDKSVTFWVSGQKFTIPEKSENAQILQKAKRALIQYEVGKSRNPKILHVFAEPSIRQIRQYNEM